MHGKLFSPWGSHNTANLINNLHMKPGDKISTYNVEFMRYAAQLNWGDTVLCHCFYQGLPNCLQDLVANWEQEKPTSFHAMYQLAITFNNRYWEQNHKWDHLQNIEKEAADSHYWKQGKMAQYSASSQSSTPSRPQSSTNPPQTTVTPLENFLRKCSMGYNLYPWISLLEFTLETSYKPQT